MKFKWKTMPIIKKVIINGKEYELNDLYYILKGWDKKPDIVIMIKSGVISLVHLDDLTYFDYLIEHGRKKLIDEFFDDKSQHAIRKRIQRLIKKFTK